MKVKCSNKLCGYEWDYKGDNPFYATCPRCLRKTRVLTPTESKLNKYIKFRYGLEVVKKKEEKKDNVRRET